MLSPVEWDATIYLDLTNMKAVHPEYDEAKETGNLLALPDGDALCSHREAIAAYLRENDIIVPRGMGVMAHLYDIGCTYDFYEYWNELKKAELITWLQDMNLPVAEILQNNADDF